MTFWPSHAVLISGLFPSFIYWGIFIRFFLGSVNDVRLTELMFSTLIYRKMERSGWLKEGKRSRTVAWRRRNPGNSKYPNQGEFRHVFVFHCFYVNKNKVDVLDCFTTSRCFFKMLCQIKRSSTFKKTKKQKAFQDPDAFSVSQLCVVSCLMFNVNGLFVFSFAAADGTVLGLWEYLSFVMNV